MAAVIGDPVTHSLSPRLHNAAFRAVGLDWVYVALPVARGQARAAVDGARALGLRGLSVTMPHKEAVIDSLDGLTSAAADLGAEFFTHGAHRQRGSGFGLAAHHFSSWLNPA